MQKRLLIALILASLCGTSAICGAATVHEVDDKTVTGDIIGVSDGKLTLSLKSATTQPTTTTTTAPTSRPTTAAVEQATIPFSDVAEIILREPPPKKPPTPKAASEKKRNQPQPTGFFGAMQSMFGSSDDSSTPPDPTPPAKPTSAPTTAEAKERATTTRWRVTLSNGDVLNGFLNKWEDQKVLFSLVWLSAQKLEIPTDHLAELWSDSSELQKKAKALTVEPGPEDIAYVKKENEVVAVKGLVVGITETSLRFRYGDQERKISLANLVGIVMGASNSKASTPRLSECVHLDTGDSISGNLTNFKDDALAVQTGWGDSIKLPTKNIYNIDFVNGRLVYLSNLTPSKVEQTPFFGRVIPYRIDQSLSGGPLELADGRYSHGIAVHTRCVLQYNIGGSFERFKTKIGFEQPAGNIGRAAIRVLSDDSVLYENTDTHGDAKPADIDVDVMGKAHLTLEVDFGKGQDVAGRVIWANPRLLRAKVP